MSGVDGVGAANRVMALRAQILERNQALSRASEVGAAGATTGADKPGGGFSATLDQALSSVNRTQTEAGTLSSAYERGDNVDIAQVMLARQKASIGFEATLQVRNKLLSAYKDIMSMPV